MKGRFESAMTTKSNQVKSFFAQPERYLKNDFNIRIRAEVTKGFVGDTVFGSILDIGCGNGAISLPLLQQTDHLTLLDISRNMLSLASSHVPVEFLSKVETINEDFIHADLGSNSYDLILCLGVLAHVDSPRNIISKMVSLLKPNGSIIVQNTDSRHPVSYLYNLYWAFRNVLLPAPYSLNRINSSRLLEIFSDQGLKPSATYRYNMPVPGMARVFSGDNLYKLIKKIYGTHTNNRFSWLGSECMYCFRKLDAPLGDYLQASYALKAHHKTRKG